MTMAVAGQAREAIIEAPPAKPYLTLFGITSGHTNARAVTRLIHIAGRDASDLAIVRLAVIGVTIRGRGGRPRRQCIPGTTSQRADGHEQDRKHEGW